MSQLCVSWCERVGVRDCGRQTGVARSRQPKTTPHKVGKISNLTDVAESD